MMVLAAEQWRSAALQLVSARCLQPAAGQGPARWVVPTVGITDVHLSARLQRFRERLSCVKTVSQSQVGAAGLLVSLH